MLLGLPGADDCSLENLLPDNIALCTGVPDLESLIMRDDNSAVEIGSADSVCLISLLGESDPVASIPSIVVFLTEPSVLVLVCSVSGLLYEAPNNCVQTPKETAQSKLDY